MLGGTLLVVCLLEHTLFMLLLPVYLVIASAPLMLLHFNLEKVDWYFTFSFLTTFDLLYYLF